MVCTDGVEGRRRARGAKRRRGSVQGPAVRVAAALVALAGAVACGPSAVGGGSGAEAPSADARRGPVAPDFTLPRLDGGTARLSDYLGRNVILIDFWSTTCDPCLKAMPELVALYDKHAKSGFVVLAVSVDGPESLAQVRSIVHDRKMRFPVLLDEETDVMARYNPKRELPFTVVIDKSGAIVHKRAGHQGHTSMHALIQAVEDALGPG